MRNYDYKKVIEIIEQEKENLIYKIYIFEN